MTPSHQMMPGQQTRRFPLSASCATEVTAMQGLAPCNIGSKGETLESLSDRNCSERGMAGRYISKSACQLDM